jgi:hypothetical protein
MRRLGAESAVGALRLSQPFQWVGGMPLRADLEVQMRRQIRIG